MKRLFITLLLLCICIPAYAGGPCTITGSGGIEFAGMGGAAGEILLVGNSTIGGTDTTPLSPNYAYVNTRTAVASGTATKAYVSFHANGVNSVKVGVWDASDVLLAVSDPILSGVDATNSGAISVPIASGTNYKLGIIPGAGSGTEIHIGDAATVTYDANNYGTPTNLSSPYDGTVNGWGLNVWLVQ